MSDLTAKHYLEIYSARFRQQENGVTNPPSVIKALTRTIVERLSQLAGDEIIILDGKTMKDSQGNLIVTFSDPH